MIGEGTSPAGAPRSARFMAPGPAPAAAPSALTAPVAILLVDDESRNLEVLEATLESPEYRLVRALTAEQALLLLLQQEFAAIVLDIQMPGLSGLELAHLIKQRRRTQDIPIIFLTAYFQEDKDVLEGYGTGAVDYLTKPINPQILKSKVAVFADLSRKTQALAAINGALELEIAQRQKAEEALQQANNELEARVAARTADLTRVNEELRQREAALSASEAQARAASRAKNDFLARLSHELRTPLNPILLLTSAAADDATLPSEIRADFETIAKNVTLEARLIDDLLDVTRIERGKLTLDLRLVDAHDLLADVLAMVRGELQQKRLVLQLDEDPARPQLWGDDVRLKQVLWNVLRNGIKFTPEGGKLTVTTRLTADQDRWSVAIQDTGIGLTPAEMTRIFEPFSQGDHAERHGSRPFAGLGLGLAISRRLVELHGGSIRASSDGRGQGAAFHLEFPLRRSAPANVFQGSVGWGPVA
jgi:signal transduction histidine kinase